ncbi:MAG: tetratricopeptide repeat protein [Sandaracinus sp.]
MLSDRGAALYAEGHLEEAEASLRLALEIEPGSAPAHANLGLVRLASGDLEGAEAALRGAIRAHEDFVEGWTDLGVVLERRGRLDDAEDAYEHALSIDPTSPEPRLALSRLLVRRGRPIEARAHLLRLVALLPDDAEALGLLAWCELRVDRPLAAAELVARALAIDPEASAARFTHALIQARRGELGQARDALLALEDDAVLGHEARLRIATLDVVAGAHLLAHARLDPLLDDDPYDPAVQLVAAVLARDEDDAVRALAHAREARTLEPGLEEAWLIEAECCAAAEDEHCAVEALAHVRGQSDAVQRERDRVSAMLRR